MRFWGNRTANGERIPERRIKQMVARRVLESSNEWVDRQVDVPFVRWVLASVNGYLRSLTLRRVLAGGRAWFDPARNPESNLAEDLITFSYDLGTYGYAGHMRFEQAFNASYRSEILASLREAA